MKAIDRKLFRELGKMRGQVITICLVVASGIAGYIAMQTTYRSLHVSKSSYYEDYRFADVFASAKRVPGHVEERLRAVPGVAQLHTRVVGPVRVPQPGTARASTGRIVSLPDEGAPPLNAVFLKSGRLPSKGQSDEVLLLAGYAEAKNIDPGDQLEVVMNGVLRNVTVTGTGMSPEYVFALGADVLSFEPGSFAVFWMRQSAVSAVFDMQGAFNDLALKLGPGASEPQVLDAVDQILGPYGAFGAYGRDRHVSNHFVTSDLEQLKVQATIIPFIFLAVAAFLVNVVLGRLVQLQRKQVATLKAVGYSNRTIGLHFLKLVGGIVLIGSVLGAALGAWMGSALIGVYKAYFRFPVFAYQFDLSVIAVAVAISLAAAVVGAFVSVRGIVALQPAEAMRPPSPPSYSTTFLDRLGRPLLGVPGRMVLRELQRRPVRVLVSSAGIALAVAILIIGRFAGDSMEHLMELHFERSMKEDITVSFDQPVSKENLAILRQLPGVSHAEGSRSVAVRLQAGSRRRDTLIQGLPDGSQLRALLNRHSVEVPLPLDGIVLTDVLADRLGVVSGQYLEVTLLESSRRQESLLVAGTVSDLLGMQGYMRSDALTRFLRERPLITTAMLAVDPEHVEDTQRRLYEMPRVAAVSRPALAKARFEDQQAGAMLVMTAVLAFFASIIAIGIVYNNARVTLSMRSRDLASMRVLGFTRAEISKVLLGELSVQVLLALPVGMWLGTKASGALLSMDPENFRMPAVISIETYAFAAAVTVAAAIASALLVRRKLSRLDLIGVLKTRE